MLETVDSIPHGQLIVTANYTYRPNEDFIPDTQTAVDNLAPTKKLRDRNAASEPWQQFFDATPVRMSHNRAIPHSRSAVLARPR